MKDKDKINWHSWCDELEENYNVLKGKEKERAVEFIELTLKLLHNESQI